MVIFILNFERVAGSLIGLAIGDAFGAPFEGGPSPRKIVRSMQEGGIHGIRRGHYTDDTLQAVAIARSLIQCGRFSSEDIMRRFITDFTRNPSVYGPTSTGVFSLVLWGVPPAEAPALVHRQLGTSRSNGSVMRGAPIGIFYLPEEVRPVSLACSRLTHHDPVAGECSAFINRMISELCRGATLRSAHVHALAACGSEEVAMVLGDPERFTLNPSLDALDTSHCAVAILLSASSFAETIQRAVDLGGDTDTIGAVCGALAGAYWGFSAIPVAWRRDLHRIDELLAVASRLSFLARQYP